MEDDAQSRGWKVDGDTVTYELDEHHTLYITREDNGIKIKVKENTPSTGLSGVIFVKSIRDNQLGHKFTKKES